MNKSRISNCNICDSDVFEYANFRGVDCIYTRNLSKERIYKFKICKKCSYTINLDHKQIDFAEVEYDNYTKSLKADRREITFSKVIVDYMQEKDFLNESINFVEIGSGYRLGFLLELKKNYPNSNFFAIDPIFKNIKNNQSIRNSIKTYSSIDEIILNKKSYTVLILRNSLEYFYPEDFSGLIKKFYKYGGLIWTELTKISHEKMGSSFCYSEYSNFYSQESIKRLFEKNNLYFNPIFKTFIYGDYRDIILGEINCKFKTKNVFEFDNLSDLVNYCLKNHDLKYVMWGLGGRNLMTLLNELKRIVYKVVDSDPKRVGVEIPLIGKVKEISNIKREDHIICLNNRFLSQIKKIYSENKILIIKN